MPMDLPPQDAPAYEVQMVREVGGGNRARPLALASPTDVMLLAQATTTTPELLNPPAANWASKDPELLKSVTAHVKNPNQYAKFSKPVFEAVGPLGIPTLKFVLPSEYFRTRNDAGAIITEEQRMSPALSACSLLDMQAREVGAWGPECKIYKFLKKPAGNLVADTRDSARYGDYRYTPSRPGIDSMRFVLGNGEGKRVDVTINVVVSLFTPEGGE